MVISIASMELRVTSRGAAGTKQFADGKGGVCHSFIVVGTAYVFPEEDESSKGCLIVIQCTTGGGTDVEPRSRAVKVAELQLNRAVYSVCPFYDGTILAQTTFMLEHKQPVCSSTPSSLRSNLYARAQTTYKFI